METNVSTPEFAHTPERVEVSATATGRCYRLTYNGKVLGDSRGFDKARIRQEIDNRVAELRSYKFPDDAVAVYPEEVAK